MKNKSITKSNSIIEAGYRLSLTEIQIVLYGISLINPLAPLFPRQYRIDIKRFAELFNREHKDIYQEVKQAVLRRFWERDFSYRDEQGKTVTNRWLSQVIHHDKEGFLQIKFSEEIQPYLHHLKKNFTTYYIDQIARFRSFYAVRFYEMSIMQLNKTKKEKSIFKISVGEIRDRLEIKEKYKRFYDLKKYILETAKKEINKYSDILLFYRIRKRCRSPYEIEFTVEKKLNDKSNPTPKKSDCSKSLSPLTIEKGKIIIQGNGNRWDIYAIEQQFYDYISKKGSPDNLEAAFLGFVKKKASTIPR